MKRLVFLVLAVCMLAMGFAVTCGAEEALLPAAPEVGPAAEVAEPNLGDTEVRPHWQVVLEDEILPIVAVVITGAASVYIMLLPVLTGMLVAVKKVKGATKLFAGATDGVLKASASSATTEERVLVFEQALKKYEMELAAEKEAREQESALAEDRFVRLLTVFATVFAASDEMVHSGAAREMMKAVEEYVGKEK